MTSQQGATAEHPRDIPVAGWRAILWRMWCFQSEVGLWVPAAGVAFYLLLAVLPGLGLAVLTVGAAFGSKAMNDRVGQLDGVLPEQALHAVLDQLSGTAAATGGTLGWGVLGTLGFTLWSVWIGMRALMAALNLAYRTTENRSFLRINGVALILGLGSLALVPLTFALFIGAPAAIDALELAPLLDRGLRLARWPMLAAMILLALSLLYRVGPCRAEPKWRWVSRGAVAATAVWLLASAAFIAYAQHVVQYQSAFGMAGAVITLMMWLNLIAYAILFGASLNAQTEMHTDKDTSVRPVTYPADEASGRRRP